MRSLAGAAGDSDLGEVARGPGPKVTLRDRIRPLNDRPRRDGAYVLYWMQQSQRASGNPALDHAIAEANALRLPVVVGFGLTDRYPEANARHFAFLLQGLGDVEAALGRRGIAFVVRLGAPDEVALALAADAALVVCDRGYLRHQRSWRRAVADGAGCAVVEVEGDVVVPVGLVSTKAEYAARTIRPKILSHRDAFVVPSAGLACDRPSLDLGVPGDVDLSEGLRLLDRLAIDRSVRPVQRFTGGTGEARARLAAFIASGLEGYAGGRSEPGRWQGSLLSPYLHFGQISPVEIAAGIRGAAAGAPDDRAAYLEELIVRRELAVNFVTFEPDYDRFTALPAWAQRTLRTHAGDPRDHLYAIEDLERAETHDPFWNAATREMTRTGFMHNTMRMYWAKKILEWSPAPDAAFRTALHLNNKYFLDGRDPSSYANVLWCFGLHDRPWVERPVFGQIRYMNAAGLRRKFDMDRYIDAVDRLVAAEAG